MRNMLIALFSGALLIGGVTLRALAADAEKKTVEGELVDTHCYAAGAATGEKHAACGGKCAKSGIPVIVEAPPAMHSSRSGSSHPEISYDRGRAPAAFPCRQTNASLP